MKKRINIKNIIGVLILIFFAGGIAGFGYRVIVTAGEVPGKLSSIAVAVNNLNYSGYTMDKVKKVGYDNMKYGYMDDLMLARMNSVDQYYESERMEEVRAVNDLTAMSQKTADKLAYEKAKSEQEAARKAAKEAALAAERAAEAKRKAIMAQVENARNGTMPIDTGGSGDTGSGDTASRGGKRENQCMPTVTERVWGNM